MKKFRMGRPSAIFMLGILLASSFMVLVAVPTTRAASTDLSSWCSGNDLSWDSATNTCTVSVPSGVANSAAVMSEDVEVTAGETLVIGTHGGLNISSGVTLTADSGANIVEHNNWGFGIANKGTFVNNGTITIDLGSYYGKPTWGVTNYGTFDNYGTIAVPKGGPYCGAFNCAGTYGSVLNWATFSNYGTVDVSNWYQDEIWIGSSLDNYGTINNYGMLNNYGNLRNYASGTFNNYGFYYWDYEGSITNQGLFNEECGGVILQEGATATSQGLANTYTVVVGRIPGTDDVHTCGPVYLNLQSELKTIQNSLSLTGLSSAFSTLQGDLKGNFSNVSGSLNVVSRTFSTGFSSLQKDLNGNFTSITDSLIVISSGLTSIQTSLSSDFSSLMSAVSGAGSTSEGTTVASVSLASVPSSDSIGSSPSDWTMVATFSSNEAVTGFTVSATKGSVSQGVLYVTWIDGTSAGPAYAIPVGDLHNGITPVTGVTSPHFSIPAGSTVYVQLVSSSKAGADVQLQFAGLPISGPSISAGTGT